METVTLDGWRPGLKKVSLNALLREQAQLGARAAHELVTALMDGRTVSVEFSSREAARAFIVEAQRLGAIVRGYGSMR